MKKEIIDKNKRLVGFLKKNKQHLVIDADTHISNLSALSNSLSQKLGSTPNYYQGRPISAEDLLAEMEMSDVNMSLVWQNPAATTYPGSREDNFNALLAANKYIFETTIKYSERFIPAGWTDPKALGTEKALKLTEMLVNDFGFAIVKLNPAQNTFPIDSDEADTIIRRIIELGATPAFHYGADTPYTPAKGLERVAEKYPGTPILAVHMGGGGAAYIEADEQYIATRELGLKHKNIKFVFSAKRDTHIESDLITYQLAGEPFSKNLFCASDAPYGRQSWNFGGFRAMFKSLQADKIHPDERIKQNPGLFNDQVVQQYLGANFAEFVIGAYQNLLANN